MILRHVTPGEKPLLLARLFGKSKSEASRPRSTRLGLECLEDRSVPAADFTVNTSADTVDANVGAKPSGGRCAASTRRAPSDPPITKVAVIGAAE